MCTADLTELGLQDFEFLILILEFLIRPQANRWWKLLVQILNFRKECVQKKLSSYKFRLKFSLIQFNSVEILASLKRPKSFEILQNCFNHVLEFESWTTESIGFLAKKFEE